MKINEIDLIKNNLLFDKVIHQEERYTSMDRVLEKAKVIYLYRQGEPFGSSDTSANVYNQLCFKVNYYQDLIKLCKDLNSKGYENRFFKSDDTYYQDYFKKSISEARKAMRKLRPYVLKYSEHMKPEIRKRIIENPQIGKYYSKWF